MEKLLKNKPKILSDFLLYLINIKNYSLNTARGYSSDLLLFFEFIKRYHNIPVTIYDFNVFILSSVGKEDIIAFLSYLNSRNNMPSTRKRKLVSIKRFYKWLFSNYKIGLAKNNPANDITIIQMHRLPKYLTLEQAKSIMNIFTIKNNRYPLRDNTIISLFLNCGLRVSELSNIDLNNLSISNSCIHIIGKCNKERIVFLNANIRMQLEKYLSSRIKLFTTSNALFINSRGDRLGICGVENICKKAYYLAGIEKYRYTTHTLRHTAATLMYQYGNVDIKVIQEFLGHKSIASTEIYAHVYSKQLKDAVDNNPLNLVA